MNTCARCGERCPDTGIECHRCAGRLRRQLLDVPTLLRELDTTLTRQTKVGDNGGRGGVIPWNEPASAAARDIRRTVWAWSRRLTTDAHVQLCTHDSCRTQYQPRCEHHALTTFIEHAPWAWLAENTRTLRMRDWVTQLHDQLDDAVRAGWRAIGRPEQRWYAGPCSADITTPDGPTICDRTLWVQLTDTTVTCPACGTVWPTIGRREWLMKWAKDVIDVASTIAAAITLMTRSRVSASQIRKWHWAKRLPDAGRRDDGAWLYRVGDVLDLVDQRDRQRARTDGVHHFEHATFRDHQLCDICSRDDETVGRCDHCHTWICEHCANTPCTASQEPADTPDTVQDERDLTPV